MFTVIGPSDPKSHPVVIPLSNEKMSENKENRETSRLVSIHLSNKEKVERLINCMKIKQEMKNPHQPTGDNSHIPPKLYKNNGALFQNRFLAQKSIIDMQRTKLSEQEKIINELKMGIFTKENTQKNDKYEIAELFHDCKIKLIGQVPLKYIQNNRGLYVKTQKAPKIIQQLEERAYERMKYREIIKDRKKKLEIAKKQLQDEKSKKHKVQEKERIKNIEILNERHKKMQKIMQIRQINKEIFLKNWNKALTFYKNKILRRLFSKWKFNYISSRNNWKMSEICYRRRILEKCFKALRDTVHYKYVMKCEIADEFQRKLLLKKSLQCFKEHHLDGIRSWQVAEDFNDFWVEKNILRKLYRFTLKEKILEDIKTKQASYHYQRKMIFYTFFHWKSLPIVMKMEKVKEERKQKWRKKVLEILPDFKPSEVKL